MAGWNADTAAGPLGAGTVTLVEGSSFCISSANGDIHPEHPHGVFHEDTRILSRWSLTVNGAAAGAAGGGDEGAVPGPVCRPRSPLGRVRGQPADRGAAARSGRRDPGADHCPATTRRSPAECVVSLQVEADFADLFEVKEARIQRRWDETREAGRRRADHPGRLAGRPEGRRRLGRRAPTSRRRP